MRRLQCSAFADKLVILHSIDNNICELLQQDQGSYIRIVCVISNVMVSTLEHTM